MVAFFKIPINIQVPGSYAEVDPSGAKTGLASVSAVAMIFGTLHSSGTATALTPYLISSATQAAKLFGQGSMLHHMIRVWKRNNGITELWAMAMEEDGGGVAATKTLTWTGTATEAGTAVLYIGGRRVTVAVADGDAAADVAAAAETAIDADAEGYVTASTALAVNTLTLKWKGATGEQLDVRHSYAQEESLPAGISLAIADAVTGATDPSLATAIAVLGPEDQYTTIVTPYSDSTNLTALETELTSRWDPPRSIPGVAFFSRADSYANHAAFGAGRNSEHVCYMSTPSLPEPPWEVAAAKAAQEALLSDPAVPRHSLRLLEISPPAAGAAFTWEERNTLYKKGCSNLKFISGVPYVERIKTMSQLNSEGFADDTLSDIEVMRTLAFISYSLRFRFAVKYAKAKLADDGTAFGAGQIVITPVIARAECLALFKQWERAGLVEGYEQFKAQLVVERDPNDTGRLNMMVPPDLINQLRVTASRIAFLK